MPRPARTRENGVSKSGIDCACCFGSVGWPYGTETEVPQPLSYAVEVLVGCLTRFPAAGSGVCFVDVKGEGVRNCAVRERARQERRCSQGEAWRCLIGGGRASSQSQPGRYWLIGHALWSSTSPLVATGYGGYGRLQWLPQPSLSATKLAHRPPTLCPLVPFP